MQNKEQIGVGRSLASRGGSGQLEGGVLGALGLAQRLQALTDENLYLEQRLEAMVMNNRALQSMRSRKPSLKC